MQVRINDRIVELVIGDIVAQAVDAIVNAANSQLAGGGGVDGAIHRAGGPAIMRETDANFPRGCPTGTAVPSGAGNLSARFVFHAVGPVWNGGEAGESQQLAATHRRCLELAVQRDCQSIAFPAISTGVFGYPTDLAARTALSTVMQFLQALPSTPVVPSSDAANPPGVAHPLGLVRFVLFDDRAFQDYAEVLTELAART